MSREKDTKYGHLIKDGHFDDSEDVVEDDSATTSVDRQHQTVVIDSRTSPTTPAPRTIRYRAVISHGDHDWEPVCTHVNRLHQLADSNQFDPDGHLAWHELQQDVQTEVLDAVAGVESVEDLDPEQSLGVSFDENGGFDE